MNRRGTLDFGGGAAGDRRLPAAGHAAVCALLGFYLASSSMASSISTLTTNVAGMIGGLKF
ncbi:hypothetical protein [Streptomyces sp. SS]|uniref:hypothetical protein n=1 Tax=Streptomyces sp. SS TaxID=260742 RepID=UPI0013E2C0A8|nr:hypothetical protein [Streptomyces sp. SS]